MRDSPAGGSSRADTTKAQVLRLPLPQTNRAMPQGYYLIVFCALGFAVLVFTVPAGLRKLSRLTARLCTRIGY